MTNGNRSHATLGFHHLIDNEAGQTTTETLMIVGLMAAVIVTVFTVLFWPSVSSAVTELVTKITYAISGGGIS